MSVRMNAQQARSELEGEKVACPLFVHKFGGEVREWPNRAVSKTAVRVTGPWVRIPPSPPLERKNGDRLLFHAGSKGIAALW